MLTGECLDIYKYYAMLDEINEQFDESIETYYPDRRLKISISKTTGNLKTDRTNM